MKFSYTILYVKDIKATVAFYESAFGLKCRFVHETGLYAEMETATVTLGFSQYELIEMLGLDFLKAAASSQPFGMQISFEPEDIDVAYTHAISHGAKAVKAPETMPWGFRCAFLRDPDGFLIELAKEVRA